MVQYKPTNTILMDIFKRNYTAVVNRGLISPDTTDEKFILKVHEEYREISYELDRLKLINSITGREHDKMPLLNEIADLMVVCANWLIHNHVDINKALTKTAIKNEERAKIK